MAAMAQNVLRTLHKRRIEHLHDYFAMFPCLLATFAGNSLRAPSETAPPASVNADVVALCGIQRRRCHCWVRRLGSLSRSARVAEHRAHFVRGFFRVEPAAIAEATAARWPRPHRRSRRESRYQT